MVLFLDCDTGLVEIDNIIKMCVKYHIHKAKCMLNVPIFHWFKDFLWIFNFNTEQPQSY